VSSFQRLFRLSAALLVCFADGIAGGKQSPRDLADRSLEDLMNIEVTTVSKRKQRLGQAPAAIYVITQEDIRRSGMTHIPDLLRMVPGLQVAQLQGGQWAVSSRGFNDDISYSNKLLVLVDGRSVYSPIDSGVFWDEQDAFLENIERIEVVRGPGAALWGSGAVNGVINIITRTAGETQGSMVKTGIGTGSQSLAGFRYGGTAGANGHYRAFGRYLHGQSLWNQAGRPGIGGLATLTGGVRGDWTLSERDSLMVKGELFRAAADPGITARELSFVPNHKPSAETSGGSLQANWTRRQSDRSETELRVFIAHPQRSELIYGDSYTSTDVDFQNDFTISPAHELIWGGAFRTSSLTTTGTDYVSFLPASRKDALFSGFVQHQWTPIEDRLSFIFGSKIEHNSFSGLELEPDARILWTPNNRHTLWAAASRAVRAPSFLENNALAHSPSLMSPLGLPILPETRGNPSFQSEEVAAFETGYRMQGSRLSVELSAYQNIYTHLRTYEPSTPSLRLAPYPHLFVSTQFGNQMHGRTNGLELNTNWKVNSRWKLISSYSWLRMNMRLDAGSRDTQSTRVAGESPRHQFQVRSNLDLTRRWQFDTSLFYTGNLPAVRIPAYARVDSRLGYRIRPGVEISLSGQNLQGGKHAEFYSVVPAYPHARVGRSFMLSLTWGE